MKKTLFIFILITSILSNLTAGYRIRGIDATTLDYDNLKNYTLCFDGTGTPIAAATMHETNATSIGKNCIVIINANDQSSTVFPIPITTQPITLDIEVRDFQKIGQDFFVICGSIIIDNQTSAFAAILDATFSTMQFSYYQGVKIFHSLLPERFLNPNPGVPVSYELYFCGTNVNNHGVICTIDFLQSNFPITRYYETSDTWEFHKIISKIISDGTKKLVVSGRDMNTHRVGFALFAPYATPNRCNYWSQNTDAASLFVVSDYVNMNNMVVFASSYANTATLYTANISLLSIREYPFIIASPPAICCVQDVRTIYENNNTRISVAGYLQYGQMHQAWHGFVNGLSGGSMRINNFFGTIDDQYEYYKIRYNHSSQDKEFIGGNYISNDATGVLFGTPLENPAPCDFTYYSLVPSPLTINSLTFNIYPALNPTEASNTQNHVPFELTYMDFCNPFKGGVSPEFSILPPENETEITNFYDRITVKDIPTGTNYQIFSITGQLIQTGTTNPDISTANLSKGMYILRLETGKVLKFVK